MEEAAQILEIETFIPLLLQVTLSSIVTGNPLLGKPKTLETPRL